MSIWLKLLTLMALVASFAAPAQAGMCNKHNPNWNPETKTCPEKPVVLKERVPAPAPVLPVEPLSSPKVTEVIVDTPPPKVAKLPKCDVVSSIPAYSGGPATYVQLNALTVAGPCGFVSMPGGGYTVLGSSTKTVAYTQVCVD